MAFRKAIAGKIRAGNKIGRVGYGASQGSKLRRWAATTPTAYWRVNGVADDSTTLPDVSKRGLGLDGTLNEAPDETAGVTKTWNTTVLPPGSTQSLRFNGTSNKITIASNTAFHPTGNPTPKLSISMWISTSQNGEMLFVTELDQATPGAAGVGWFYGGIGKVAPSDTITVYWNTASAPAWRGQDPNTGLTVTDDEWHNIVWVYDGTISASVKTYVDGVLDRENSDQSGNLKINHVPILLGYRRYDGPDYYKYYMDEMTYWTDVALTAEQVKDVYNNGKVLNSYAGVLRG